MSLTDLFLPRRRRGQKIGQKETKRRVRRARLWCEVLEERMVLTAKSAWTVMVYVTADNQLASGLNGNIKQLESALAQIDTTAPDSVQIAVLYDQTQATGADVFATPIATAGGTKPAQTWTNTGEAILQPNSTPPDDRGITTPFTLLGAQNSGTTATFTQFVNWASTNAPANHYAMIFEDHGAGWRGFNNYGQSSLKTPAIAGVLNTFSKAANPVKFDLIGFDECLMADAQAETAIASQTQVIVGSEELESGTGWDFTTALSALNVADPGSVTASQVATGIVKSFSTTYVNPSSPNAKPTDTLSAVQASALANLDAKLKAFTDAVLAPGTTAADWNALAWARNQAPWFSEGQGEGYRDLGAFLKSVANSPNVSPAIKAAAANANTALSAAIITKTNDKRKSSGLTVYLPAPGETVDAEYFDPNGDTPGLAAAFVDSTNWFNFLTAFTQNAPAQATVPDNFTGGANRSAADAFELHQLIGPNNTFSGLSLPDADPTEASAYFHFAIAATGVDGNAVTATYAASAGNLRLTLLDANSNEISDSDTGSGLENISLAGLSAGNYFIVVDSSNNANIPNFTLNINAPTPDSIPADWATGNGTQTTAFNLGTIAGVAEFSGLTLAAGDIDWFKFDQAPNPDPNDAGPDSLTVLGSSGQNLNVQLLNSQGQVLASQSGSGAITVSYPQVSGGDYSLQISGAPGGYAVHFNPPVLSSNSLELDSDELAPGKSFNLGGAVEDGGTPLGHTVLINWGDGSPQTTLTLAAGDTTFQAPHQYAQVGSFTITVTAADSDGAMGSGSVLAVVQAASDEIPSVQAGGDVSLFVGQTLSRTGTVSLASGSATGATVNFGDGKGSQPLTLNEDGTFVLSHTFATAGVFTATVQVTDTVGAVGTATFGINAQAAPTITHPASQLAPVTLALSHSPEFEAQIVNQEYQLVLHRAPEAAATSFWVTQLQGGLTQQSLAAALLSSTEFVARNSNANWLQHVYQVLFNRSADQSGLQYWQGLLGGGISKGAVASTITNSSEFVQSQITGYYQRFLGRSADTGGLAFWTASVESGNRLENMAAGLAASDEFFSKAGNNSAVAWIDAAYEAFFGRLGSTAEESFWLGQI